MDSNYRQLEENAVLGVVPEVEVDLDDTDAICTVNQNGQRPGGSYNEETLTHAVDTPYPMNAAALSSLADWIASRMTDPRPSGEDILVVGTLGVG